MPKRRLGGTDQLDAVCRLIPAATARALSGTPASRWRQIQTIPTHWRQPGQWVATSPPSVGWTTWWDYSARTLPDSSTHVAEVAAVLVLASGRDNLSQFTPPDIKARPNTLMVVVRNAAGAPSFLAV